MAQLKMNESAPTGEYMNAAQRAHFEHLLLAERGAILRQISAIEAAEAMPGAMADPVDRASFEEQRTTGIRSRMRLDGRLREIDRALARLASGEYGYCMHTGEPIGIGRLLIQPVATLSVYAQERQEQERRLRRAN